MSIQKNTQEHKENDDLKFYKFMRTKKLSKETFGKTLNKQNKEYIFFKLNL